MEVRASILLWVLSVLTDRTIEIYNDWHISYLKDSLYSPPDKLTGFCTHNLPGCQDAIHNSPIVNVVDCHSDVMSGGLLLCPQVCGNSIVSALNKKKVSYISY